LDEKPGRCRTLSKQLLRSGTSIGANLREAQSAESNADFIHKLQISLNKRMSRDSVLVGNFN
jgi:four helix bundle protein